MGLAGQATHRTPKRKEHLTKAIGFIDMSFDGESEILLSFSSTLEVKANQNF